MGKIRRKTKVTKLLTVKRSMFFVAFLALALVGMAIRQEVPTASGQNQESTVLYSDDIAYAESNTTVTASSGSVSGSQVTFGLAGASASSTTVANGPAVSGVDYQSYANTIASDLSSGAASGSAVTVDTSGYSLPLQYDTYLSATITGTYNGTDYYADTTWSGTVLAHAGFSTDNPDLDMADSSVSFGYVEETPTGGGGGGYTSWLRIASTFSRSGAICLASRSFTSCITRRYIRKPPTPIPMSSNASRMLTTAMIQSGTLIEPRFPSIDPPKPTSDPAAARRHRPCR